MGRAIGWAALGLALVVGCALGATAGCNAGGFDPQSKVDSVRIFGVRADKPYAKPGEQVTLEVLMTDGRADKPRPAKLYWIPIVCVNPRDDLYYLCFAPSGVGGADAGTQFVPAGSFADAGAILGGLGAGGAGDAGASANPLEQIPKDVDLGPFLPQGTKFSFTMPTDVVQPRPGTAPYGLAYAFAIACAGEVRFGVRDPAGGPQQLPIRCTDEAGKLLTPADYVIGYTRVYSYADRTNTNPVIERVTFKDEDVDLTQGIRATRCKTDRSGDCEAFKLDVVVSDASWEENPGDPRPDGTVAREQIWVAYYADRGEFENEARLLFDVRQGRVTDSAVKFRPPQTLGKSTIWAVVHDNRGGASFLEIPLEVVE